MRNKGHNILRQKGLSILRNILPLKKIREISKTHYPRGRERALTIGVFFGLLIFAHLQKGVSSIEELLALGLKEVKEIYGGRKRLISKQSFSRRSKILPWTMFKECFEYLLGAYERVSNKGERLYHKIYEIKVIDSTILDVVARLIGSLASQPSRRFKKSSHRKGKIKAKVVFNQRWLIPELVVIGKAVANELKGCKSLVRKAIKKGSPVILVFDLGFLSYDLLKYIMDAGSYFVSRIKENTRYEIVKKISRNEWLVKLGVVSKKQKPILVRLVRVKEKKKWYYYITNLPIEIGRKQIREIYRYRWSIEQFFKDLKHVLNTLKIFSYEANGIKSHIYAALSAYVLGKILIAQSARRHGVSEENFSFKRTITMTRIWLNHNPDKIFQIKSHRRIINELLDKIFEFAYQKPRRSRGDMMQKEKKDIA